jgi:hypothetical protein
VHQRAAGRRALAKQGLALGDGSFPVPNGEYWDKARQAIGRVKDPQKRAQVAKLLRKTAPRFGKTQALKDSWAAPGGSQHANAGLGLDFTVTTKDDQGMTLVCPECDYSGPASSFGANGASLQAKPEDLRTPAPSTAAVRDGVPLTVKGNAAHALANGTRGAVELASGTIRRPIKGPMDVLVARGQDGTAVLKHRNGGAQIASLRKTDDGRWVANVNGKDGQPRDHQRTALMEAVGQWNGAIRSAVRPQEAPLQGEPQQTPLMAEYGIPAMRSAAFATPVTSSSSGPRMTTMGGTGKRYDPDHDGDNDASPSGDTDKDYAGALNPKGKAVYRKLTAKGWPPAKALAFAKHAQSFGAKAA